MIITIRVPWQDPYNTDFMWNELLAWTCETYGLPGDDNWRYHPTHEYMDFHFRNENDALMFQLKTAGQRRDPQEQAVELMGVYINKILP
jgi:hypothetical protein